jgi:hypothetical protein
MNATPWSCFSLLQLGIKVVAYLDNDQLNKPNIGKAEVYTVEVDGNPMTKEQLTQIYPTVFADKVSLLEGEYHIRLDPQAEPVQNAPRRVAHTESLWRTLEDLVRKEVIAPVTQPTPWVSSMVAVPKQDGKMRICLDPQAHSV